jgi:DNA sulfur modification protein DndB
MITENKIEIQGQIGFCGHLSVFLGFAKASLLYAASFADTMNDDTGEGYQRPVNRSHSRSFRNYITNQNTSTIPLTFNLRPNLKKYWTLTRKNDSLAILYLNENVPSLARVDCQHRINDMADSDITFAFMTFIGIDINTEMALFNIINSKAKGLSSSLTDFHQSRLIDDLANEAPHLFIARQLNEEPDSPWFKLIRYGGVTTSGLMRRTSFRMIQSTIKKSYSSILKVKNMTVQDFYFLVSAFWMAVKTVFIQEWNDPRHHLLTKGIGLYSLMELFTNLVIENRNDELGEKWFEKKLGNLRKKVDWSSSGTFAEAGGKKGAHEVFLKLKGMVDHENTTS